MKLDAYLERVGVEGSLGPDLETLRRLHLAHQLAVPFENLDVQLKRPLTIAVESSFEKIVTRRRGGWCYEMNGLMGWALREIGFDVRRIAAGVMREERGPEQVGNHLCLLVRLGGETWLVDVGFGGSLAEPMPLRAFEREDHPYRLSLRATVDGYWRFSEMAHSAPFSFDFQDTVADEELLARKCQWLQTDPTSGFVQNLVVQRRSRDVHTSLRGRVLTTSHRARQERRTLDSADELVTTLSECFDLNVPEAAALWPAIRARHEALFGDQR